MTRKLTPFDLALWAALPMAHTTHIEGRLKMILNTTRSRRALTRRVLLLVLAPGAAALVMLAMLRLDARVQASPATAAVAAAPTKTRTAYPRPASKTLVRYFLSPGPPYRLMKKQGRGNRIVWGKSQPASLPITTLSQVKPKAVPSSPKSVSAALLPPVVRVAQLPREAVPPPPPTAGAPILPVTGLTADSASILAGVTDADKPDPLWWSPSGALLPKPVYDTAAHHAESHAFGGDTRNVIFAFRLPAESVGATVSYKIPGALCSSSEGSWLSKMQGQERQTEAQAHAGSGGARVVTAAFPASLLKTDIQVGIASGPWKVAATYVTGALGRSGNIGVRQGNSTFLFSPVSETKDGTIISIATDATDDLRVVAVDAQGKESLPDQPGDNSMGTLDQITVRFALPPAQIKEVRVETRPFRYVEFRNVALRPAP